MVNCTKCEKGYPEVTFYSRIDSNKTYRSACKECENKRQTEYRRTHKANIKNTHLKYKYGITLEDYNKMFTEQKGRCAICSRHQSEFKKALHTDHDHLTGKVRKLLCAHCNRTIGQYKDDPTLFDKFAEYLRLNK